LQVQLNEPAVLVHICAQPPLSLTHSFTSAQVTPLPAKPVLHVQVNEPVVSVHVALVALQLCVPMVHSLTLLQLTPAPVKPRLQAQTNEPAVSVHVALAWQLCEAMVHSSWFSRQSCPCQPLSHRQTKEWVEGFLHPSPSHCACTCKSKSKSKNKSKKKAKKVRHSNSRR
jgi:hypothetical protein